MADDTDDNTNPTSHAPINLPAGSFNLQDLEKASKHAEGLKTDKGQTDAFARMIGETILDKDEFAARGAPATPEGHRIGEIEDANGRLVQAPVLIADEAETEVEEPAAEKPKTRGN